MLRRAAVLVLAAIAFSPAARADDCILDNCVDKRPPIGSSQDGGFDRQGYGAGDHGDNARYGRRDDDRGRRRGGCGGPRGASRPGDFAFYVLSLSWVPGFCSVGGGDDKGRAQCRRGADTGFTVHGLWPQYDHGFPSDCRGDTNPPRAALASTDGVYPDEGLARYEWRKHGTCSGLNPFDYFAAAKRARDAVVVPDRFKDPHGDQHVAPAELVRAFTDANPRLRPGMVAAICRGGTLEEVRVCLTKDLETFQACPEVVRDGCRGADVDVPPVR